jgi:hypothetical protein
MSYTIQWSSQINGDTNPSPGSIGKDTIIIADQTSNTSSTSITLTGKGLVNYGQYQQENFIQMMENFASQTSPANPTVGQQWYDTTVNTMNVYVGSAVIPGVTITNGWAPMFPTSGVASDTVASQTSPANPTVGQIWYDTTNQTLNVYTNAILPGAPVNATGWSQFFPSGDPALGQMWQYEVPFFQGYGAMASAQVIGDTPVTNFSKTISQSVFWAFQISTATNLATPIKMQISYTGDTIGNNYCIQLQYQNVTMANLLAPSYTTTTDIMPGPVAAGTEEYYQTVTAIIPASALTSEGWVNCILSRLPANISDTNTGNLQIINVTMGQ